MESGCEEASGHIPASKGRILRLRLWSPYRDKHGIVEQSYFESLCLLSGSDKEFIYPGNKNSC